MKNKKMRMLATFTAASLLLTSLLPGSAFAEEIPEIAGESGVEESAESLPESTEESFPGVKGEAGPESGAEGGPESTPESTEESFPGVAGTGNPEGNRDVDPEEAEETLEIEEIVTYDLDALPSEQELEAGFIEKQFYGDSGAALFRNTFAGDHLSQVNRNMYNQISANVQKVAAGELASTIFSIGSETILPQTSYTASELGIASVSADNCRELAAKIVKGQMQNSVIMDALVNDMPYELFWFNKGTGGMVSSYTISYSSSRLRITGFTIKMTVADAYRDASEIYSPNYTVDLNKILSVQTSVANAKAILEAASGLSDEDMIRRYRDEICELTSYNREAASPSYTDGYGDPWQLVYVFDGDPETKVVCEGYAKAFQYLMDESAFSANNIYSYIVTGDLSGNAHMWNIVHMDDDRNYLVDVTNSDSLSKGPYIRRFMQVPDSGDEVQGYYYGPEHITWEEGSSYLSATTYHYDQDTVALYGLEDLVLSEQPYKGALPLPAVIQTQPKAEPVAVGNKAVFHLDAVNAAGYQWEYSKNLETWKPSTVSTAGTDTLSLKASKSNAANYYRCAVTGQDGSVIYSKVVKMNVLPWVEILSQPQSVAVKNREVVTFRIEAENAVSYQWQYSKNGSSWNNSTLEPRNKPYVVMRVQDFNADNLYRCVITGADGTKTYSEIADIIVLATQPKDKTAVMGTTTSFTVKLADTEKAQVVSYQWEYSKDGNKWVNSTVSTAVKPTIKLKVTEKTTQNQYRCKLTTTDGRVAYTYPAKITAAIV